MYPLHCDNDWIAYLQKTQSFPAEKLAVHAHVTIGSYILWVRRLYKFVLGKQHCWNVSTDKDDDNSLHNFHSNVFLRQKFFNACEIDFGEFSTTADDIREIISACILSSLSLSLSRVPTYSWFTDLKCVCVCVFRLPSIGMYFTFSIRYIEHYDQHSMILKGILCLTN